MVIEYKGLKVTTSLEQAVKPFIIQRKLFQTSGSYAGARYTGKIFSIIQTCLINNVNVEKYLEYVLNNLNRKPIEELLPYSKEIRKMKWWVELSMALFGGLYQKYDSVYYAESYFFIIGVEFWRVPLKSFIVNYISSKKGL